MKHATTPQIGHFYKNNQGICKITGIGTRLDGQRFVVIFQALRSPTQIDFSELENIPKDGQPSIFWQLKSEEK